MHSIVDIEIETNSIQAYVIECVVPTSNIWHLLPM
jgi:hypothetical protein